MKLSRIAPLSLALLLPFACGGSDEGDGGTSVSQTACVGPSAERSADSGTSLQEQYDTELPMVTYEWDPNVGDPSVPAELGGPGFTGEGWQTNMTFPALGSSEAKKGGTIRMYIPDWPATLRQTGKDWNTSFNYRARDLCIESLLTVHPVTLEFIPNIATHWWISPDKMTYRFRINPAARFSDGEEVTAEDVIASFNLHMDETILFPSAQLVYSKLNTPTAVSKYIVEVTVKKENWRNFLYFAASLPVLPAHQISIPGSEYLDKFQFKFTAVTGPYTLDESSMVTGQSLSLVRRDDWWQKDNPAWQGLYNFDRYTFTVVMDPNLAFEKTKKGELDYYDIPVAKWWAEELPNVEAVQRGLLVRRKFYTDAPIGTSGTAINMLRPPLDDVRIRKALCHLENRKLYIEKLFHNEYLPLTSYYQGGTYQNPNNEPIEYDELKAVELLEEAGWTELDSEGYRIKDGKRLEFTLIYRSKMSERYLTIFQENCKKAGIKIELQQLTSAAHWKQITGKDYDLASTAWGAIVFPNPETSWHSRLAKEKNNNNITGFADPRVDELCEEYDREYDVNRRIEIIREIDGIIYEQHPYILGWYNPAQRVVYWNKFGMPKWGTSRTGEAQQDLMYSWWIDPEKERALEEAQRNSSITLEAPPIDQRFWQAWHEVHGNRASVTAQ